MIAVVAVLVVVLGCSGAQDSASTASPVDSTTSGTSTNPKDDPIRTWDGCPTKDAAATLACAFGERAADFNFNLGRCGWSDYTYTCDNFIDPYQRFSECCGMWWVENADLLEDTANACGEARLEELCAG